MSEQTNTQIVRDAYAAFQRGDIPSLLGKLSDNVEWTLLGPKEIAPNGTRHGRAEVADFFGILARDQVAQVFDIRRYVAEDDLVVVLGHWRWLIKATGRIAESDWVHVFTFCDGLVTRFQEFSDTANSATAYLGTPIAAR